jgi:NFU1 iron-sulfur cluster scaffold homolog, mitochondrial
MSITVESTPNPNAKKFSVGRPVGGPATHTAGSHTDDPVATALLAIPGVASVFMTADFVTVSKAPDADWSVIESHARSLLSDHFD